MKFILAILTLISLQSAFAATEVVIYEDFASVTGSAAKEIYNFMKVKVSHGPGSEADGVTFKKSKTMICHYTKVEQHYSCNILLKK